MQGLALELNADVVFATFELQDPSLPRPPDGLLLDSTVKTAPDIALGALGTLHIKADSEASIAVFNSDGGRDPDAVLAKPHGKVSPIVPLDPLGRPWLKYRLESTLGASVGGGLDTLKLGIDTHATAIFSDYRRHAGTDEVGAAVARDLAAPRFALRYEDVLALAEGEAVAARFTGSFTASVSVSWADVFSSELGLLTSLLPATDGIRVKIDSGLKASGTVIVSDDFRLVFAGLGAGKIRVSVMKARSRGVGAGASAGVTARLAFPSNLVEDLLSGLLGETFGPAIEARLESLTASIKKMAETKISAAYAYEYKRISSESVLLLVDLDRALVDPALHLKLCQRDVSDVLALLKQADKRAALGEYLREKSLTTAQSWGFALNIGKWKLFGKDRKETTFTVAENIHEEKKVAYEGVRGYQESGISWSVDLKADMDSFSPNPVANDFNLGAHLAVTLAGRKAAGGEIALWLDWGRMWTIFPADADGPSPLAGLDGATGDATFQLRFDHGTMVKILDRIDATAGGQALAAALATAMPWRSDLPARQTPGSRRSVYLGLWAWFLAPKRGEFTVSEFANQVVSVLERLQRTLPDGKELVTSNLINFEKLFKTMGSGMPGSPLAFVDSFYVSATAQDVRVAADALIEGLTALRDGLGNGVDHERSIKVWLDRALPFGAQQLYIRALGVFLLDAAISSGVIGQVRRTFLFSDSKGTTTVVAAPNSAT